MREPSSLPWSVPLPAAARPERPERRALPRDAASIWRALCSPWAWAPPAVGLALLAALVAADADRAVFLALNHGGAILGTPFWLGLTLLGDGAVALALVLPCIRRAPRCFWAALVAGLVAAAWAQGWKYAIEIPRPLTVLAPDAFVHAGPAYRHASFPSGHAAAAFALGGVWAMTLRSRLLRLPVLALAALVALSRVMVGVHWPVDLLGGMLGGWLGAWLGLALAGSRGWHTRGRGALAAGGVLLALCVALLVVRHGGTGAALALQRLIGTLCLAVGARELAALRMGRARHVR